MNLPSWLFWLVGVLVVLAVLALLGVELNVTTGGGP